MRKRILKARRDRWVNAVIKNGKTLDKLYEYRGGLIASIHPEEAAYTDAQINRLERRRDALLAKLKETA